MKVLILTCATGEGHNSAAKAIQAELKNRCIDCETLDVFTFKSERAKRRVASVYSAVISKTPVCFGIAYAMGALYDNLRLPSPIYYNNAKFADRLYRYIKDNKISCVICTHLYAMETLTAVRRKFGCPITSYGVLTDYTAIPFYKDTDLDGYFVATEQVSGQLMKKGFKRNRIFVTGIPVHPKFSEDITKDQARAKLGIPADKKVVLVMTGGTGCGKILKLCAKFDKALSEDHSVIILSGKNKKLKIQIDKRFDGNNKFTAVEFTPEVNYYIRAANIVITKPGGLSSTEIAVCNVPLIHVKAIPGVETANLKYFSENGLSLRADSVKKAVTTTVKLLSDNGCADAMKKIQKFYIGGNAAELIARRIAEGTENEYTFVDSVNSRRIPVGQCDVLQTVAEADIAQGYM